MSKRIEGDLPGEETHSTCTSTPLSDEQGSSPEHIFIKRLDQLHKEKTGTKISSDPVVAVIQREQALVWHKRRS